MEENTNKSPVETVQSRIPARLRGLSCEPALLEGEDPNLYWALLATVIDERQPVTVSDWIAVNDLVTNMWDERVYRRAAHGSFAAE